MSLEYFRQAIASADAALFRLINSGCASRVLDAPMIAVSVFGLGIVQSGVSLLFVAVGMAADSLNLRRAGYASMMALAAAGMMTQLAKLIWDRPRPVLALFDVRIVDGPLFAQSFPSGHATSAFAAAVAWSAFVPRLRYVLIPLAFATGFSRVYLGVHFPLDVAYGALLGAFIGSICARAVRRWRPDPAAESACRNPTAACEDTESERCVRSIDDGEKTPGEDR